MRGEREREKGKQGDKMGEAAWRCQGERPLEVQMQFSSMVAVAEAAKQGLCACVRRLHNLQHSSSTRMHARETERERAERYSAHEALEYQ